METDDERLERSSLDNQTQMTDPQLHAIESTMEARALTTSRSTSTLGVLTIDMIMSRLGIYDPRTTKELILRDEDLIGIDDACAQSLMTLEILSLSHNKLVTLQGFQYFTNLIELNINFNHITSLEPLQCFEIEKLFISNNRIVDLSPLKAFTKLTTLSVYGNLVNDLDSALSTCRSLPKLKALDLGGNPCAQELEGYKFQVVRSLPRLKLLDGDHLTQLDKDLADEFILQGRPATADSSRPSTATTIGARPLTAKPWESDVPVMPLKPAFDPFTSQYMPKGNVRLFRDDFLNNNPILLEYLAQETQESPLQETLPTSNDTLQSLDSKSPFVEKMRNANPIENGGSLQDDPIETERPQTAGLSTGLGAVLTTNLGIDPSDPKATIRKLLKHIELLEESLASYKTRQDEASEGALLQENRQLQTENNNIPILQDEIANLKKQLSINHGLRPPAPMTLAPVSTDVKRLNALEQENEQLRREVQRLQHLLNQEEIVPTEANGTIVKPKRLSDSLLLEESATVDIELTELILQNEVSLEMIRNDIKNTKKEWEEQFQAAKDKEQERQRMRPQTSLGLLRPSSSGSTIDLVGELIDGRKVGKPNTTSAAPSRSRQVHTSAGFRHNGGPEERLLHSSRTQANTPTPNANGRSVTNILTL